MRASQQHTRPPSWSISLHICHFCGSQRTSLWSPWFSLQLSRSVLFISVVKLCQSLPSCSEFGLCLSLQYLRVERERPCIFSSRAGLGHCKCPSKGSSHWILRVLLCCTFALSPRFSLPRLSGDFVSLTHCLNFQVLVNSPAFLLLSFLIVIHCGQRMCFWMISVFKILKLCMVAGSWPALGLRGCAGKRLAAAGVGWCFFVTVCLLLL